MQKELYNDKQSMLMEKEVVFEKGRYKIGPNLKISRTIDKLELLFVKFLKEKWDPTVTWFIQLKQAIQTRNNLVHLPNNKMDIKLFGGLLCTGYKMLSMSIL